MSTMMAVQKQVFKPQNEQSKLSHMPDSFRKPLVKSTDPMEVIKRLHMKPESVSREELIMLQNVIGMRGVERLLGTLKSSNKSNTEEKSIQKKEGPAEANIIQGENKTSLPEKLKTGLETISNLDLSDVNVHYNSDKPSQVGALAYTQGSNIFVAPNQERHLPHEGWHAVQQKKGIVEPTLKMEKGIQVNDDFQLEKEADVMGEKAAAITGAISKGKGTILKKKSKEGIVQRFGFGDFLEGVQVAAELAAAIATGGGSIFLQIGVWLATTLPQILNKVSAIMGFVNTIRSINFENIKEIFTPAGIGNFLVKGLFGEVQGLQGEEKDDKDDEREPEGGKEGRGLMKVLGVLTSIFKIFKKVYGKVSGAVNKVLSFINISNKPWFAPFSMIYAGAMKALELVQNPGEALNEGAAKIKEAVAGFFNSIRTKITEVASNIKQKLALIVQPAQIMKLLANKAVDMVLNFIITHPPSALIKALFKVIESISGQSIVDLVRKYVPFADTIINKIAESGPVQGLMKPLQQPINKVTGMIDTVTGKATGMVNDTEQKTSANFANGEKLLKSLAVGGKGGSGKANKGGGDFLSNIKSSIHTRIMAFGQSLLAKGKDFIKAGVNKIKSGVGKIKGMIIGKVTKFRVNKESHELWLEKQGNKNVLMMASGKGTPIEQQINLDSTEAKNVKLKQLVDNVEKTGNTGKLPEVADKIREISSAGESKDDLDVTKIDHGGTAGTHMWVEANPLTEKGEAGSPPKENCPGWEHAQDLNKVQDLWVKGHLLNEHLHGPGVAWNLVPLNKRNNSAMAVGPEKLAKSSFKEKVLYYRTDVTFHSGKEPIMYFPKSITIKVGEIIDSKISNIKIYSLDQEKPPEGVENVIYNLNNIGRTYLISKFGVSEIFAKELLFVIEKCGQFKNVLDLRIKMQKYYNNQLIENTSFTDIKRKSFEEDYAKLASVIDGKKFIVKEIKKE